MPPAPGQTIFLDVATRTGWALRHPLPPAGIISGSIDHGADGPSESIRHGRVAVAFARWLVALIAETGAGELVMERFGGSAFSGQAGRVVPGLGMVALGVAVQNGLAVHEVASNSWKAAVIGHGRATKPQIMSAIRRLGHAPRSQDEADALALRLYWLRREQAAAGVQPLPLDIPLLRAPARRRRPRHNPLPH